MLSFDKAFMDGSCVHFGVNFLVESLRAVWATERLQTFTFVINVLVQIRFVTVAFATFVGTEVTGFHGLKTFICKNVKINEYSYIIYMI